MDLNKTMGQEKIPKLLLIYSIPAIIATVVSGIYTIISSIFIGNHPSLGVVGIATLTLCFPMSMIIIAAGMLFGGGGTTLFSIRLGEQKQEEAAKILGTAIFWFITLSLAYTVLGLAFLRPLLILFGATPEIMPYAQQYMSIMLFGAAFQLIGFGGNNFIRADGSPKIAMISMLISAIANIAFNFVFIYIFDWGMAGAALAGVGGSILTAMWVLTYFLGKRSNIKLTLNNIRPNFRLMLQIAYLGMSLFLMQLANSILSVIINKSLMTYGGEIAISTMGVIIAFQNFMIMPVQGLMQGAGAIISFNYGFRKFSRVREILKLEIIIATILVLLGFIITRIYPEQIIRMFSKDPQLIDFGTTAIKIWFLCFPVVGFHAVCSNYFQAVGKPKHAAVLTLTRQLIFIIPLLVFLPVFFGLKGIFYSAPISDLLSAMLVTLFITAELRRLKRAEYESYEII